MADKKISALTAASTPLAGTEVLPIVQSGATVKVAVSDLTAGRAISASSVTISGLTASTALALDGSKNAVSVTNTGTGNNVLASSPSIATPTLTGDVQMTTGNLVVGTSGKGIDFSATPGTGTSELFDDYEEGTFTPGGADQSGHAFPGYVQQTGTYTKIGNTVFIELRFRANGFTTGMTTGQMLKVTGLPFAISSAEQLILATTVGLTALAPSVYLNVVAYSAGSGTTSVDIFAVGGDVTPSYTETQFTVANFENGDGAYINISGTYLTS
jgi:hypothetical protein